MLDASAITHPSTPPSWLDEWPSPDELDQQFSIGQRRLGINLGSKLKVASLEWGDDFIRARMDGKMCTWSRKPAGWVKRCTCGAPENRCPHSYMTCMLLQKVFMAEGWVSLPSPTPLCIGAPSVPIPHELWQPSLPGTSQAPNGTPGQRPTDNGFFLGADKQRLSQHLLEVEVDFKHEPGMATLRFYDRGSGVRELMTLATLHPLGFNMQRNGQLPGWSERDASFIQWVFTYVKQVPWQMRNTQVLKVQREAFSVWQQRWSQDPQRFIERSTQQFLQISDFTVPVNMTVELIPENDHVRFHAAFVLPGGTSIPVHEYLTKLQANPEREALRGRLRTYTPPIDWDVLYRNFSEHPPRVKRALVAASLPELLHGHLEILKGECVQIRCTNRDRTEIYAGISGAQFFLNVLFDGVPVALNSSVNEKATVRDNGEKFIVTLPNNEALAAARKQLATVPFPVNREEKRLTFFQYPANAQALKDFWRTIPASIRKNCCAQLKPLLCDTTAGADADKRSCPRNNAPVATPFVTTVKEGPLARIDIQWAVDGHMLDSVVLSTAIGKGQTTIRSIDGSWLEISPDALHRAMASLAASDVYKETTGTTLMARHAGTAIQQLQTQFNAQLSDDTAQFMRRLAQEPPLHLPPISPHLQTILRPYQKDGILFLLDRIACGAGVILADDMGLGKTLQILAALDAWRQQARRQGNDFRALVVCPASVMHVWKQQVQQFCPEIATEVINGSQEQRRRQIAFTKATLIITHYQLARIDREMLAERPFDVLILDEAQAVKNPEAQVTLAIRSLQAKNAIAVTGTPLENSLLDLWSIMSCINPGFLGSRETFQQNFGCDGGLAALNKKLKPLILRRTKKLVAKDLPERTEQVITLDMPPEQQKIYDEELVRGRLEVKEQRGAILGVLTRLREICCHPNLVRKDGAQMPSAKMERLLEQLATLNDSGHSTLVFSQYTAMLDLIATAMDEKKLPYRMITGTTPLPQRQKLVQDFANDRTPSNMLLSLKAAGTGLTLTKADYVFLFDPWWNPAVEQQAIDRAHRIGQENHVFAYKYVTAGTVEEKVMQLLARKRELFNAVMDSDEDVQTAAPARLTQEELESLIN